MHQGDDSGSDGTGMKRILLVDDHQMFLEALCGLLEKQPDIEVVGVAHNGLQAIQIAAELLPDIVLMDVNMPGLNGIATTRQLLAAHPDIKVLALSTHVEQIYVNDMMRAGALGYISKSEGGKELLRAIEAVSLNRHYWCPSAIESLARTLNEDGRPDNFSPRLAARELQVLRMVANGLSSQQIAVQLNIAFGTVEVHRRNIMRKLGLHSAVELTRYAIDHDLLRE
jgi:DNA-binding NarL/FixJ family response regulator